MVSALANIVAGGNSATQSLSDAFATANHEFGMADRLIGGYQVTDQVPNSKKEEEEEEEQTTDTQSLIILPAKEVDNARIIDLVGVHRTNGRAYQLSLLSLLQPVAEGTKNGRVNGHQQNGHHQNGHQNGASATHAKKNGHVPKANHQNGLISVPQLDSGGIPDQVRVNKGKVGKRRRKAYRGPSLFDWLEANQV